MVHRLERLAIWLTAAVGGVGLVYVGMTASAETSSMVLGVLYVLGFALLAVGILGFASEVVIAVHGRLPGTEPTTTATIRPDSARGDFAPMPPQPATVAQPNSGAPAERVFVPPSVTPRFLTAFFDGRTDAQGQQGVASYLGKWMRFDGPVANVQVFETTAVVSVYLDPAEGSQSVLSIGVSMWFSKEWKERAGLLGRGDEIAVVAQISSVGRIDLQLRECEIVGP